MRNLSKNFLIIHLSIGIIYYFTTNSKKLLIGLFVIGNNFDLIVFTLYNYYYNK